MSDSLLFIAAALATYRITHLITTDTFPPVRKVREAIVARKPDGPLAYLVECQWCVSVYVAAGITLAVSSRFDWGQRILFGLALSAVTGFLSAVEPD